MDCPRTTSGLLRQWGQPRELLNWGFCARLRRTWGRCGARCKAPALTWSGPQPWREDSSKPGQQASTPTGGSQSANPAGGQLRKRTGVREQGHGGASSGEAGQHNDVHAKPAPVAEPLGQLADIQQPTTETETVLTFAYGANMNFLTLARRDVRVLSRDPAVVADPSIRLVFKHQGGYATLERIDEAAAKAGTQVEPRFRPYDGQIHGVLYRVTREDFEKLAKREGGYVVQQVPVQTYDGTQHTALAFVSNPLFKLPQEVLPTEKYLSAVREGARDNYLDPGYQAFLSGISTVPSAGLGPDYYNTPSKYMGYSFLVVAALITLAFFFQH